MEKSPILPPFKRFCVTIGNLPSSYVDSMSYYECLMWLCKYLKETVIPVVNENAEAVNELINWFNNLDVQDEIDNKLDEMVESGELQEIISEYLNSQAIFSYNSVSDMKSATNLINGSTARTLGYYELNDGGGALYKIRTVTNDDDVDDMFIIEMNDDSLVAELIIEDGSVNLKQLGAKSGDSNFDNSPLLKKGILKATQEKEFSTIKIPSGYFYFKTPIDFFDDSISVNAVTIEGEGQNYTGNMTGTVLAYFGPANSYFIRFKILQRSTIKNMKIIGTTLNNCFEIENHCSVTNFEDLEFGNFLNNVWLKEYTGYVYFNRCHFDDALNNVKGVILNQHYQDNRPITASINTEYVYFNQCAFEGNNHSAKHLVIYEGSYIYVNDCDFCNSSDTAIYIDASGWGAILDDITINNCSFARNKHQVYIKSGNGECRGIKVDGHFLRYDTTDTSESIIQLVGSSASPIWYLTLSGACQTYANCVRPINCAYAYNMDINIAGEKGLIIRDHSSVNEITKYPVNNKPNIQYVTPTVSVNNYTVTYDLSSVLDTFDTYLISLNGVLNSAGCAVSALLQYGSAYGHKVISSSGANITSVTFANKIITVVCNGFVPSSSLDGIRVALFR